ncbi:MAG TPA: RidA family protein [Gemmatales bacterium]|nr:RidA family protein [Gemmatales bacterium]HMP60627.1 RidA family protein [Gemmatales bacterium]
MARHAISSGAPWEGTIGYSRAVRVGNAIHVSGTAAVNEFGEVVYPGNAVEQTRFILKKIAGVLEQAGAELADVVRTRIYVLDISQWEAIGTVHGEVFGAIRPAATMVEVRRLIDPDLVVEIEVDAVVDVN